MRGIPIIGNLSLLKVAIISIMFYLAKLSKRVPLAHFHESLKIARLKLVFFDQKIPRKILVTCINGGIKPCSPVKTGRIITGLPL